MSKLIILPTADKNNEPTYHLKSEYSEIDFSKFDEKRDYDFEEKNPSENYAQIYITTSYTISVDNSEHFCRLDIISPFEVNKHVKDFSEENFKQVLEYHIRYVKEFIDDKILTFPNSFRLELKYKEIDVENVSEIFYKSL